MDAQFASAKAAPCTLFQFSMSRFKWSVLFIYKMDKECPPPVSVSPNSANWPHTQNAARTVLIGRSRIQIASVVLREGNRLFCQRATVISSADRGRGRERSSLSKGLCACLAGDHPSRKGRIWIHHLLGFPRESAGCRSR